jgi:general secretion pathway protein G
MENIMKRNTRGFTLVEILIVVIILGILVAIVIPQFTNASTDAKNSSVASTIQTIRSQIELFKIQHGDVPPQLAGIAAWQLMLNKSSAAETAITNPVGTNCGPYLQAVPVNPLNGKSAPTSAAPTDTTAGWYYSATTTAYTIYPRDITGASVTTY